nr:aspartoacylase [Cytophagales bacterium]
MPTDPKLSRNESKAKPSRVLYHRIIGMDFPTLVITVGIHGNEPASISAMRLLFSANADDLTDLRGNVYVIVGNEYALQRSQRFIHKDLNRIWDPNTLNMVRTKPSESWPEIHELHELKEMDRIITQIVSTHGHQALVFLDLHTTSADSAPFLPFNDALMNRRLAAKFPLPLILGIEEYLDGPLMSYINNLGFPALGFEAGRHDDPFSIDRHVAFVSLVLFYLKMIDLPETREQTLMSILKKGFEVKSGFYEIIHRHEVLPFSGFKMIKGFRNFQTVDKNELLANAFGGAIHAIRSGLIFMPLYQDKGNDGFFIIRPVSDVWLRISAFLRKNNLSQVLRYLPGIHADPENPSIFWVNPRITRFFPKEIFHLFGFRIKRISPDRQMLFYRE